MSHDTLFDVLSPVDWPVQPDEKRQQKRAIEQLLNCQQARDTPTKNNHYQLVILSLVTRNTRLHDWNHPTPRRADGRKLSQTQVRGLDLFTLRLLGCRMGLIAFFLSEVSGPCNADQQNTQPNKPREAETDQTRLSNVTSQVRCPVARDAFFTCCQPYFDLSTGTRIHQ